MENKKYVSEEQYEKGQLLLKKIRFISIIVMALLIIGALALILKSKLLGEPKMGELNWVETTHKKSRLEFHAIVLLGTSAFVAFGGVFCITLALHERDIEGYNLSTEKPIIDQASDEYADIIDKNIKRATKSIKEGVGEDYKNMKFCTTCNRFVDLDFKYCPHCGKQI
ncbi:MAG: zinc ribbon domain-containing protein [Acholeplasmatales bacterium]|nr:zinc ribbon domain-containing protein [Acholeplasmatales bacterium]